MLSGPAPWIAGAALVAVGAAWFRYAVREERVPGRAGPAILHALALFLLLAGLRLPSLRGERGAAAPTAVLVDLSASMSLPARPGDDARRLDSALARLAAAEADLVLGFGDSATTLPVPAGEGPAPDAAERRSRLAPGLRAARRAGAAAVVVLTDGEIEDREEARSEARRLGLSVEEVRVAVPVLRTVIREARGPARAIGGDTVPIEVELRTLGEDASGIDAASDSVGVIAVGPDGARSTTRVARPDPGRSLRVSVRIASSPAPAGAEWRTFEVHLSSGADPLRPEARTRVPVEVVPAPRGAVLVSVRPDREPGLLLPILDRASAGGARGFVRLTDGRWASVGPRPAPAAESAVRRAAESADLLVVQGGPGGLPGWLASAASGRPLLLFAREAGVVPGGDARVGSARPGEWYPVAPVPSSPVAGYVAGLDLSELPPVGELRASSGGAWTALAVARDRRGDPRPLVVGLEADGHRRAVVLAPGTWRWAARTGRPREVYRALFSGVAGWLQARDVREPVTLEPGPRDEPESLVVRTSPGVRDLVVSVRDSVGTEVARDSIPEPERETRLAVADGGDLTAVATGHLAGRTFRREMAVRRPGADAELTGRPTGTPIAARGAAPGGDARNGRRRAAPPVWPFALAAAMFCAEWGWRRRIGLR